MAGEAPANEEGFGVHKKKSGVEKESVYYGGKKLGWGFDFWVKRCGSKRFIIQRDWSAVTSKKKE